MNSKPMIYLSGSELAQALPMQDAIEAVREAFIQLSAGKVTLPVRECIQASGGLGVALIMPCYSPTRGLFSVKNVTVFPDNLQHDLPTNQGLVILTDGTTGSHLAVVEGSRLTAIRTGAASGVATDCLAPAGAATAAIFGAGVQARTQLEAVCRVRPIRQARVYDRNADAAKRYATEMTELLKLPIEPATSPADNLQDADIVCTATPSYEPLFDDNLVRPGTHINAVGAFRPEMVEIPDATVSRSIVVVDHRESAFEEAGDLIQPIKQGVIHESHVVAELGEILAEQSDGRQSPDDITLFKSVGVAIQDLYAAAKAVENAHRLGLGIPLMC